MLFCSFAFLPMHLTAGKSKCFFISKAEEISGLIVNVFTKYRNALTDKTGVLLPLPTVDAPSWAEYSGEPSIENPVQTINGETWVMNETAGNGASEVIFDYINFTDFTASVIIF